MPSWHFAPGCRGNGIGVCPPKALTFQSQVCLCRFQLGCRNGAKNDPQLTVRGGHRLRGGTRLAFLNVLLVHDSVLLLAPGHVSFGSSRGEGTATQQTEVAGHVIHHQGADVEGGGAQV